MMRINNNSCPEIEFNSNESIWTSDFNNSNGGIYYLKCSGCIEPEPPCDNECITRWTDGTLNWPDSACSSDNLFTRCNTNSKVAGNTFADYVCQKNSYDRGIWTGNFMSGCSGNISMDCGLGTTCNPTYEYICDPSSQSIIEIQCCGEKASESPSINPTEIPSIAPSFTPTMSPLICSEWLDRDDPTGNCDCERVEDGQVIPGGFANCFQRFAVARVIGRTREYFSASEIRSDIGQVVTLNANGLRCQNVDNPQSNRSPRCFDYEVKFCCPFATVPPTVTTKAPTTMSPTISPVPTTMGPSMEPTIEPTNHPTMSPVPTYAPTPRSDYLVNFLFDGNKYKIFGIVLGFYILICIVLIGLHICFDNLKCCIFMNNYIIRVFILIFLLPLEILHEIGVHLYENSPRVDKGRWVFLICCWVFSAVTVSLIICGIFLESFGLFLAGTISYGTFAISSGIFAALVWEDDWDIHPIIVAIISVIFFAFYSLLPFILVGNVLYSLLVYIHEYSVSLLAEILGDYDDEYWHLTKISTLYFDKPDRYDALIGHTNNGIELTTLNTKKQTRMSEVNTYLHSDILVGPKHSNLEWYCDNIHCKTTTWGKYEKHALPYWYSKASGTRLTYCDDCVRSEIINTLKGPEIKRREPGDNSANNNDNNNNSNNNDNNNNNGNNNDNKDNSYDDEKDTSLDIMDSQLDWKQRLIEKLQIDSELPFNIKEFIAGLIGFTLWSPIGSVSTIFYSIGELNKDILAYDVPTWLIGAFTSLLFWFCVLFSDLNDWSYNQGILNALMIWCISIQIGFVIALKLEASEIDDKNPLIYIGLGAVLIGPFLLFGGPLWVKYSMNIWWYFYDLMSINIKRYYRNGLPLPLPRLEPFFDHSNVIKQRHFDVNYIDEPIQYIDKRNESLVYPPKNMIDYSIDLSQQYRKQSTIWIHIRYVMLIIWIPLSIPMLILYPFSLLFEPLLLMEYNALIQPIILSIIHWLFIILHATAYNDQYYPSLLTVILTTFLMMFALSLLEFKQRIKVYDGGTLCRKFTEKYLFQLVTHQYEYRMKFPLLFIMYWLSGFGVVFGLLWIPYKILKELHDLYALLPKVYLDDVGYTSSNKDDKELDHIFWDIDRIEPTKWNDKRKRHEWICQCISSIFGLVLLFPMILIYYLSQPSRVILCYNDKLYTPPLIISSVFFISILFLEPSPGISNSVGFGVICWIFLWISVLFAGITAYIYHAPSNFKAAMKDKSYWMKFIGIILFMPVYVFGLYYISFWFLRYMYKSYKLWGIICCISNTQTQFTQIDDIEYDVSDLEPNMPITKLLERIMETVDLKDNDLITKPYVKELQKYWYYRIIDLLYCPDNIWDLVNIDPLIEGWIDIFLDELRDLKRFKYFSEYNEIRTNNVKELFDKMLTYDNKMDETEKDLREIHNKLNQLCLENVYKITKRNISLDEWNEIIRDVPDRLGVILSNKFRLTYSKQNTKTTKNKRDEIKAGMCVFNLAVLFVHLKDNNANSD